ncbi:MAG: oligosaccharide flippase family protein [Gammaproteobacteria bacterium]|nr:oligosaccharide flippase family protein [Gammaproteobacteria bacterium]MCP5196493.1 oligosaccharide flippase family protein [Gammaproteobacteria bacterium]
MAIRRALGISGLAQLVAFILNFISVIIVSRLLTPEEIGVFSVAVAVLGLAHIFREFGVGQYLIQASRIDQSQFRAAFSVTLFSSWIIAVTLFLLRTPLARFYGYEGVAEVLALLALNFLILPFGTPLLSLLRRELEFNKLALVLIFSAFVQTSVTIGSALAGESYLSMAWGSIASHIGKVLLLNFIRPGKTFILPTFTGLGEIARFGSISSLTSIIRELGGSAPDLILGRTLGFVDVAYFSRAVGLRKMLIEQLINLVRGVHFPTFASNLRKGKDAAQLYCQAMNYMVAITAPLLAVLALLADPLIIFLFGSQWERSVPIAILICIFSILISPYSLYGLSLIAAGKIRLSLQAEIAIQSAKIFILLSSIWFNLEHVVLFLGLAFLVEAIASQYALQKAFGLSFKTLLNGIKTALLLIPFTITGPGIIVLSSHVFQFTEFRFAILASGGALAALGWLIGVFLVNHAMKIEIVNIYNKIYK